MNEALRALLKDLFAGTFGSQAGGTGYPIANRPSIAMAITALVVAVAVIAAVRISLPRLRGNEPALIASWLTLAFAVQLAMSNLAYASLATVVESKSANGFYFVSQQYPAATLLSRFHEIAETVPLHARANLPGKTLLYHALSALTTSPRALAYLIILISNLGAVLVYRLAKDWFDDALTAFYAMVLYLFVPARMYFVPLLNVVSPVLMLLVFWLVTRGLRTRRPIDFMLAGVALYALTIFEPLPLAAMPLLVALVTKPIAQGDLTWARAVVMAGWSAAAFAVVYLLMRIALGFDLVSAFTFALADARAFNQQAQRPYGVWIVHNLKDFFLNMGLAQSAVFLALVWSAVRALRRSPKSWSNRDVVLPIALLAVLLALDIAGINRGETVRLWIFLGVLLAMFAARACATSTRRGLFELVLAISLIQTAVCSRIVGWIIPY